MKFSIKDKVLITFPVVLLLSVLLGLYIPYLVYITNANEFSFNYWSLALPLLIKVSIWFILLGLLISLVKTSVFKVLISTLMILVILSWLQADMFVTSYGALDGSNISFADYSKRGISEFLIMLIAIAIAVIFRRSLVKQLPLACLLIAIGQLSLIMINLSDYREADYGDENFTDPEYFHLSQTKNIILIVLDTFGSEYFSQAIKKHPEFVDNFEGFVHYPDTISNYPYTKSSIPSILSGLIQTEGARFDTFAEQLAPNIGVPKLLSERGFKISLVTVSPLFKNFYPQRFTSDPLVLRNDLIDFYSHKILDLSLFRMSPHYLKPYVYNQGDWLFSDQESKKNMIPDTFPEQGMHLFNSLIDHIRIPDDSTKNQPRFKLYHSLLPHPKYVYDENCNKLEDQESERSFDILMFNQSVCTLRKLSQFFDKLKSIGAYRNSLIIVTSDHGSRIVHDWSVTHRPSHLELSSSGVMFMVKAINQNDSFITINKPLSLIDLKALIMDESRHQSKLDDMSSKERLFYSYDNANQDEKSFLADGALYQIDKNYKNPDSWHWVKNIIRPCEAKQLPINLTFKKNGRDIYCAKYGFNRASKNGSGTWTISTHPSVIINADLSQVTSQELLIEAIFETNLKGKQKRLAIEWIINGNLVKTFISEISAPQKASIKVPTNVFKNKELNEISWVLKNLSLKKNKKVFGIKLKSLKILESG